MSSLQNYIQKELEEIKNKNRYRFLKIPNGIDLSSNDYLCLSKNPKLISAFKEGIDLYGTGSTASRLIRGHRDIHEVIEEKFANWVKSETSLFLANGFSANVGLMEAISNPRTFVFTDRLNHASILDGIRLSQANKKYYHHLDMNHLEEQLKKTNSKDQKIIVSETVFSMDGDLAPISELIYLKKKYDACLILDEAHALGVFGEEGSGLSNAFQNKELNEIDFRVYTGGKSLGLEGAFIATSNLYKEYLINTMRTFIFSTAPCPAIPYALLTSIDLVKGMDEERIAILKNAEELRNDLKIKNYETLSSKSQIVPIVLYEETKALQFAQKLQEKGFDIRAIRPPTVKESRLRISINAGITPNIIKYLLNSL